MDAAASQWFEEIKADFIEEVKNKTRKSFNTASSLKSLKSILKKAVVEARDSIALCAPERQRRENSEFGQQHKASVATKLALS